MSRKNYTKVTAQSVKSEFSRIIKRYIGPAGQISYKQAARELAVEDRTLGSWVRGEKQVSLSSLLKLSLYLPTKFTQEVIMLRQKFK